MSKYFVLIAGLIGSSLALAQEQSDLGRIRQVLPGRNRAVVQLQSAQTANLNDELIATFKDGKQCALRVLDMKAGIVLVDTSDCSRADDLVVGQAVEKSLFIDSTATAPQPMPTPQSVQAVSRDKVAEKATPTPIDKTFSELAVEGMRITDIAFRPLAHQFLIEPSLSFSSAELDASVELSGQKSKFYDQTGIGNELSLSLAYGITDYFAIKTNIDYLIKASNEIRYGPASVNNGDWYRTNASGIRDPSFEISFRVPNLHADGASVDLTLSHTPRLVEAESATRTTEGNGGRGGTRTEIGVLSAKKLKFLELGLSFRYLILGARTVKVSDGSDTSHTTGGNTLRISGLAQFNLSPEVLFRVGFGLESVAQTETEFDQSTSFTRVSAYTVPLADIGLLADLGRAGFGLLYQHSFETDVSARVSNVDGSAHIGGRNIMVVGRGWF